MKYFYIIVAYLLISSNSVHSASWDFLLDNTFNVYDTVAISPHDPSQLFLSATTRLYQSKDVGKTWNRVGAETIVGVIKSIAIDPQDTSIVYVATTDADYKTSVARIFKSMDNGASWTRKIDSLRGFSYFDLKINQHDSNILYIAGDGSLYPPLKSLDGGETWERAAINPPDTFSYSIPTFLAVDPQHPNTLYLNTDDSPFNGANPGLYKSLDQGQTWTLKRLLAPYSGNYRKLPIAINPQQPNTLYLSDPGVPLVSKSVDGGDTWQIINDTLEAGVIVIDPHHPEIVYLGTDTGLYRTANGGKTWHLLSNPIDAEGHEPLIRVLAIDPHRPEMLYVGTQNEGLYRVTTDSDCVAHYEVTNNVLNLPCVRVTHDSPVFEVELTGRNTSLVFDVSGVEER